MDNFKVGCNSCGCVHEYDCQDLDLECVESHERQMGTEKNFVLTIEKTCGCSNEICIECSRQEYPVGTFSDIEIEVSEGAVLLENNCN